MYAVQASALPNVNPSCAYEFLEAGIQIQIGCRTLEIMLAVNTPRTHYSGSLTAEASAPVGNLWESNTMGT